MGDCFRLGDLVRAKVVRSFFLFPFLFLSFFAEVGLYLERFMAVMGGDGM
jgi:hypothetical protein